MNLLENENYEVLVNPQPVYNNDPDRRGYYYIKNRKTGVIEAQADQLPGAMEIAYKLNEGIKLMEDMRETKPQVIKPIQNKVVTLN